jgi:hypothetical protein
MKKAFASLLNQSNRMALSYRGFSSIGKDQGFKSTIFVDIDDNTITLNEEA